MTTTTAPPRWGHYSSNATCEYPAIAWSVLTPPQTDVVYLSTNGLSQREIAMLYHVSQPAICKHMRRALERLSTSQPRPEPLPELELEPVAYRAPGRLCAVCDSPGCPCDVCVASMMRQRP